jgi:hypothetical protein
MEDLLWGVEPGQVLASVIIIGGAIIGFMFKINRCVGRQEGTLKEIKNRLDILANSYLEHLDKKNG